MMIKLFGRVLCLYLLLQTSCTTAKLNTPTIEMKNESAAVAKKDTVLESIMARYPQYFDTLLRNNNQWRVQIIYSQIDRGNNGAPRFTHHYFNVNQDLYFYPASTVKMPIAFLALQKLNELNVPGVTKTSTMITEAGTPPQTAVYNDPTTADGRPSVANYIKKIFLVSDNDAYNRLYEFLGQDYINTSLHKMGYNSVQILHRLELGLTEKQNRSTNPVKFYAGQQLLYQQPEVYSEMVYQPRNTMMGTGYQSGDQLIEKPFDFSKKNRFCLADLHSVLQCVMFPESVSASQRFNLKPDDYSFLYRYMSMKPKESSFPKYDSTYTDAYVKFLMFGGGGPMDDSSLRIFNKPGDAYGFLTDVAYITDFEKGVEFLLSATIYCNSDGIFNDNHYDYKTVGFPFLKHLGEAVYNHELQRVKTIKPNLQKFRINYSINPF